MLFKKCLNGQGLRAACRTIALVACLLVGLFVATEPARADDMDSLIAAAKAEGNVTFYTSLTENVGKRIANAFQEKYGIRTQFVRLSNTPMLQRYASEAESGNVAADAVLAAGDISAFMDEALRKGWVQRLDAASIPVLASGAFPARFARGTIAVTSIQLWVLAYNTDRLKGSAIPQHWNDLLQPSFKGQIIINDPNTADTYLEFWTLMLDKYGESFLTGLRGQQPRQYPLSAPAIQALAAGEGTVMVPGTAAQVQGVKDSGAPLSSVTPDLTTGIEIPLFLTASSHLKHLNAARLFANYVLSAEGSKVVNADPGSISPYDTGALPKQYETPRAGAASRRAQIRGLLGF